MSLRQATQAALKFFPALSDVALLAARTKLTIMNVRSAVARHTRVTQRRSVLVLGRFLDVAAFALDLAVRAVQHVLGAFVVVEVPQRPRAGVVATLTAHAQLQFMAVILLVARITIFGCIFEAQRQMTTFAGGGNVSPGECELRQPMVVAFHLPDAVGVA